MLDAWAKNNNPDGVPLTRLILADLRAHGFDPMCQGFLALAHHRVLNVVKGVRISAIRVPAVLLARLIGRVLEYMTGITITHDTVVMPTVRIWHHGAIIVNAEYIGPRVSIRQGTTIGEIASGRRAGRPSIHADCDIGCNVVIVGNVTIGSGATIGAGSVVVDSVEPGDTVAGSPARSLRYDRTRGC